MSAPSLLITDADFGVDDNPTTNSFAVGSTSQWTSTEDPDANAWAKSDGTWRLSSMYGAPGAGPGTYITYTPVITGSSSNPNLGSTGTITGEYTLVGDICFGEVTATFGGTGISAGSGRYIVTLPPEAAHSSRVGKSAGEGTVADSSASNTYVRGVILASSTTAQMNDESAGAVGAASPMAPATGDIYTWNFAYRIATSITGSSIVPATDTLGSLIDSLAYNVRSFGATGDGSTDDTASIQNTVNAAVTAGGGYVFFPPGEYKITDRIYINSDGTSSGVQVDGIVLGGVRTASQITATTVDAALSVGKRAVDSNAQASGICDGVGVENLEVVGSGIEFWGCQRDSFVRNVRVDLTGATTATRGFYGLFSSTLQLLQFRVDNGGNSIDGITLDTCSDTVIVGGGANYGRNGLTVEATQTNSNRTTGLTVLGFHTEGDRRRHIDLQAVGNARITPHVVTSSDWDTAYPLVHIGSNSSSTAISVRLEGGYITGSGAGGSAGTCVVVDYAVNCLIDGTRIVNADTGIQQTAHNSSLEMRRPRIESVTTPILNDSGAPATVLPGTQMLAYSTQGAATLSASNTVSLTVGGLNSSVVSRVPVIRAGSVVGIGLRINSTLTAGTLTVQVQLNASDVSGCSLVKGTGGSGTASVRFPPGTYPFATTDDIRIQVTTSAAYAVGTAVVPVVMIEYLPG